MSQYAVGTVSLTNGSATVTGSGTLFTGNVAIGNAFLRVGDAILYDIANVVSNTQLTLSGTYQGVSGSGLSYVVAVDFTTNFSLPELEAGDLGTAAIFTRAMRLLDTRLNRPPSYTDGNRPSAGSVPAGFMIWNTTDNALNVSDGTNWRTATGTIT